MKQLQWVSSLALVAVLGSVSFADVDRDRDKIPDSKDNCSATFNPEQMDQNRNGIGDACDLNAITYGSKANPLRIFVGKKPRQITIAKLSNNTKSASKWRLQSRDKGVRFASSGDMASGRSSALTAVVSPLGAGASQSRLIVLNLGFGRLVADIFILVVSLPEPPPETCQVEVVLDTVKVTKDQGFWEGELELQVEANADTDKVTWPSVFSYVGVSKGNIEPIGAPIRTFTVLKGSPLTIDLRANVEEFDDLLNGDSDTGSTPGSMTLQCDVPDTKTLPVSVNGATVEVTYLVRTIH